MHKVRPNDLLRFQKLAAGHPVEVLPPYSPRWNQILVRGHNGVNPFGVPYLALQVFPGFDPEDYPTSLRIAYKNTGPAGLNWFDTASQADTDFSADLYTYYAGHALATATINFENFVIGGLTYPLLPTGISFNQTQFAGGRTLLFTQVLPQGEEFTGELPERLYPTIS
jgi:hypothetical protein